MPSALVDLRPGLALFDVCTDGLEALLHRIRDGFAVGEEPADGRLTAVRRGEGHGYMRERLDVRRLVGREAVTQLERFTTQGLYPKQLLLVHNRIFSHPATVGNAEGRAPRGPSTPQRPTL